MFVLDCSAIAKSFLNEHRTDEVLAWLDDAVAEGADLWAPPLALSEVARTIQKRFPELGTDDAKELWRSAMAGIRIHPADPADCRVWDVASSLTYYDAEYVSLAVLKGAGLVTADKKQAATARSLGVDVVDFVP